MGILSCRPGTHRTGQKYDVNFGGQIEKRNKREGGVTETKGKDMVCREGTRIIDYLF